MVIRDAHLDKVKKNNFELQRHYDINNNIDWEAIKRMAIEATAADGHGRIICSGNVHYKADNQNRLFVCKLGYNVKKPYTIVDWSKEDFSKNGKKWYLWQNDVATNFVFRPKKMVTK